ncbi:hypothetical protein M1D72_05725 [Vibrio sp. AK197]|uniref:hypothetical protein n=1 Tax=Vibrio parahaemolyticus TaxID=670 RepID=UPI0023602DF9|nr:hypothetical protein [Vibrio parahaemolyticus]
MKELLKLYESYSTDFENFWEKYKEFDVHGPILMSLESYFTQPKKVMIVGQETHGWCQSPSISEQIGAYKSFNFGETYRSTPFWNVIRKIESTMGLEPYSIAWSNLNRYDQACGSPKLPVLVSVEELDHLLKAEVSILKPDVLILFTNHKYDSRLHKLYPEALFENIPELPDRHFKRVSHPELPSVTIRAPHPKTIRMQSWERSFIEFIEKIA